MIGSSFLQIKALVHFFELLLTGCQWFEGNKHGKNLYMPYQFTKGYYWFTFGLNMGKKIKIIKNKTTTTTQHFECVFTNQELCDKLFLLRVDGGTVCCIPSFFNNFFRGHEKASM